MNRKNKRYEEKEDLILFQITFAKNIISYICLLDYLVRAMEIK